MPIQSLKVITKGSFAILIVSLVLVACQTPLQTTEQESTPDAKISVMAVETFLVDVAQNVTGERVEVEALLPLGLDPHTYEPTPLDLVEIAESQVLIINGAGFEEWLNEYIEITGGEQLVLEASQGLMGSSPRPGDPHFWLDPISMITYVENIGAGLAAVDPEGAEVYERNAEAYIEQLKALDAWIAEQVAQLPADRRVLVTNHESFGYFADRYGFTVIGTIIPSASTGAAPSARQLVQLVDAIKKTNAPAIFLESGSNPQLAQQVARETGVQVIEGLYTHSVSPPGGEAPSYIAMMEYNTRAIVEALK